MQSKLPTRLTPAIAVSAALCSTLTLANPNDPASRFSISGTDGVELDARALESFDGPWAMTFLNEDRALVSEKGGTLWLLDATGQKLGQIDNVPSVTARGQGGLGDVIAHPDYDNNGTVFLSYVERDPMDDSLSGAVVERATLVLHDKGGELSDREIVWRQQPKVTGNGHYGHRLAIGPNGHLFITSGERQKFTPAQNMAMNLGKIIRINQDGSVPKDNPFTGSGGVTDQIWTLGHRNPLGIDFDADGQLWVHEMGPKGGDELNRIVRSENYGYPDVSEGVHYNGKDIPTHESNPAYENPALSWTPVISPSGFVIYDGKAFADWQGDGLMGGLSSQALVRVEFEVTPLDNQGAPPREGETEVTAREAARYEWGKRVREVEQGPNGALYVLEDGEGGRLLKIEPSG